MRSTTLVQARPTSTLEGLAAFDITTSERFTSVTTTVHCFSVLQACSQVLRFREAKFVSKFGNTYAFQNKCFWAQENLEGTK